MKGRLRDVVLVSAGVSLGLLCSVYTPPYIWLALVTIVCCYWTGFGVCWVATWLDRRGE